MLVSGAILCASLVLTACTTNKVSPATLALQAELEAKELQLQQEQAALETRSEQLDKRAAKVKLQKKKNASDSRHLRNKERQLERRLAASQQTKRPATTEKSTSPAEKAVADMLLVGATEKLIVHPLKTRLAARMDTGAKRCMLGVFDLAEFERDGEPHVRFFVVPEKGAKKIEVTRPIKDHARFSELNSNGKKTPSGDTASRAGQH